MGAGYAMKDENRSRIMPPLNMTSSTSLSPPWVDFLIMEQTSGIHPHEGLLHYTQEACLDPLRKSLLAQQEEAFEKIDQTL